MWKVFVSYHINDEGFYKELEQFSISQEFTIFRHNLYATFKTRASRLFRSEELVDMLHYPDLALVVLSPSYLKDEWMKHEMHALYVLEQTRRKNFILPVILDGVSDDEIPLYFREQGDVWVDFRSKESNPLNKLASLVPSLAKPQGKIFIGHGRSLDWLELKEFLLRERLEYDEFNRVSRAGMANKEVLAKMMESASFAFLVMTAEDVHSDQSKHARENVIHEVGLFQGRLGFDRAILLIESGCEEFSNVSGVVHISFPKGNIDASFEKIRKVLEREGFGKART